MTHAERKVPKNLVTTIGVRNLGVEQQCIQVPIFVRHGGHGRIRARGDHRKARRGRRHEIPVTCPDPQLLR